MHEKGTEEVNYIQNLEELIWQQREDAKRSAGVHHVSVEANAVQSSKSEVESESAD